MEVEVLYRGTPAEPVPRLSDSYRGYGEYALMGLPIEATDEVPEREFAPLDL